MPDLPLPVAAWFDSQPVRVDLRLVAWVLTERGMPEAGRERTRFERLMSFINGEGDETET